VKIARSLLDEVVEHAIADAPNECCGLVVGSDGVATGVRALENLAASPFRFDIDGRALLAVAFADDGEEALTAIYHSHTRSAPYPSQTDVNYAAGWPGVEWLIVGVPKDRSVEPEVRSYLIENGVIREVDLEVT